MMKLQSEIKEKVIVGLMMSGGTETEEIQTGEEECCEDGSCWRR